VRCYGAGGGRGTGTTSSMAMARAKRSNLWVDASSLLALPELEVSGLLTNTAGNVEPEQEERFILT
jgi:hypothetical protein